MVDLPLAERPVNQSVKPFWPRRLVRSWCVTDEGCHVMFLTKAEALAWIQAMLSRSGACAHLRSHYDVRKRRCMWKKSAIDEGPRQQAILARGAISAPLLTARLNQVLRSTGGIFRMKKKKELECYL